MKKIVSILVLSLISFALLAQNRFSYSVEVAAGAGIGKGPLFTITPEFVAQYDLGRGFIFGAGAGMRISKPCLQYITNNGNKSRSFCNEQDVPLFLRFGYGKEKLFAHLDAGYSIGVLSYYSANWIPGGKKKPCYNGFFVEPQLGWRIGRRSALSLGLLLQQSAIVNRVTTDSGTPDTPSYSTRTDVQGQNVFTPAITLRYGFLF